MSHSFISKIPAKLSMVRLGTIDGPEILPFVQIVSNRAMTRCMHPASSADVGGRQTSRHFLGVPCCLARDMTYSAHFEDDRCLPAAVRLSAADEEPLRNTTRLSGATSCRNVFLDLSAGSYQDRRSYSYRSPAAARCRSTRSLP